MFIIGIALFNETHQTITVFLNQIQFVKCGMSEGLIGFVFILANIAGLSSMLSSKITKIIGVKKIIPICFLVAIFACFLMAVNSVAFISIFAILILRIAFSIFQPLQSKLQNVQVKSANRATTLSVFSIIMNSIGISTNLIFGAIAEIDIAFAFYCGIAFCLVGLILTSIWAKKTEYKFLL